MTNSPPAWKEPLLLAGAFIAAAGFVVVFPPEISRFYPQCMFKALTGWLCPGCGGTRALYALANGQIGHALVLNPLVFLVALFLLFRCYAPFAQRIARLEQKRAYTFGLIFFLIAFTLIRNSG